LVVVFTHDTTPDDDDDEFTRFLMYSVAMPRGFEPPPPLSSGATHEISAEPMRRYWGYPPSPRNIVSANMIVLVPHLVTFSESQ